MRKRLPVLLGVAVFLAAGGLAVVFLWLTSDSPVGFTRVRPETFLDKVRRWLGL